MPNVAGIRLAISTQAFGGNDTLACALVKWCHNGPSKARAQQLSEGLHAERAYHCRKKGVTCPHFTPKPKTRLDWVNMDI